MADSKPTWAIVGLLSTLLLQGCDLPVGNPPEASTTRDYYDNNATTPGPFTTTTTTELATNIWQWRRDMLMHQQISWDVSEGNKLSYGYEPCWAKQGTTVAGGEEMLWTPMDEQFIEGGETYGTYDGETGVTLFNKLAPSTAPATDDNSAPGVMGCLMRKTRYPIDFSSIGRIEFDISTSGGESGLAPWSAIWFAPMTYYAGNTWPAQGDLALSAEIDVIENFVTDGPGDVDSVKTQFSMCHDESHCKSMLWSDGVTKLHHHITMELKTEGEDRVIKIVKCEKPADKCDVDSAADFAQLRSSPIYPVWNKEQAGELYAKYWMVSDIWYTSNSEFELSVGNISFFFDNGTEWKMPLGGQPFLNPAYGLATTTIAPLDSDTTTSQEVLV